MPNLTSVATRLAAGILLAVTVGCSPQATDSVSRTGYIVPNDDPEMNAAIVKAIASVDQFIDHLPELEAGGHFYGVKFPLSERGDTEHVWINYPVFRDGRFTGLLASSPVYLKRWSLGDEISVAPDQISDWFAITDDTLYGGFTLFVLNRRMPPEDREAMYAGLGMEMPDRVTLWE